MNPLDLLKLGAARLEAIKQTLARMHARLEALQERLGIIDQINDPGEKQASLEAWMGDRMALYNILWKQSDLLERARTSLSTLSVDRLTTHPIWKAIDALFVHCHRVDTALKSLIEALDNETLRAIKMAPFPLEGFEVYSE